MLTLHLSNTPQATVKNISFIYISLTKFLGTYLCNSLSRFSLTHSAVTIEHSLFLYFDPRLAFFNTK
jgi:hypothetical protein